MNFKKLSLITHVLLLVLCIWVNAWCTSDCHQEFIVLGKTVSVSGDDIIWVAENINGACLFTVLVKMVKSEDTILVSAETLLYKDWKSIGDRIGTKFIDDHVDFRRQDSLWVFANRTRRISIPSPDSAIWNEFIRGGFADRTSIAEWNAKYGYKGIIVPEIGGLKTKLIYSYPQGLYMNYYIDRVCYFGGPKCFYLLVFTNQPRLASGLDTMHGFLLLQGNY